MSDENGKARWRLGCCPRLILAAAGVAALGATLPSSASAQQLRGTLLDAGSRDPIASATVELLSPDGAVRAQILSGTDGGFVLAAPSAGTYEVRAWRIGADTLLHGPLTLEAGETLTLELLLRTRPIELDAIDVTVERIIGMLEAEGFYERQRSTSGVFLTPQRIEEINPDQTVELLRRVQGLEFHERDFGQPTVMTRTGMMYEQLHGRRSCLPVIYLDGYPVQRGGRDPMEVMEFPLTTIIASTIVAVEVYPSATLAPLRFSQGESTCGIIVIWTGPPSPTP